MELRILRYFLVTAREKNITRAADILHITQPTLSRQLAQLEEELGVPLFERGPHKFVLTTHGEILLRRAQEIAELITITEKEVGEDSEAVNGTVSIAAGEVESIHLLAELMKGFKQQYPNVHFELYAANANLISERIDRGLADIALFLEPVDIDKYDFIRLGVKERYAILLPAGDELAQKDAVTAADLVGKNIILPWRATVKNELKSWFGSYAGSVNIILQCNMSTNASVMVQHGLGYSINIEGSTPYLDPAAIVKRPLAPELAATTVLAWKKHQPFNTAVTRFIEYARKQLTGKKL